MAQQEMVLPHKLTLSDRSKLAVTGVTEVVSFDDNLAVMKTTLGTLVVQGRDLQLKSLGNDGAVAVEGTVSLLQYEQSREKGGWLSRLLR